MTSKALPDAINIDNQAQQAEFTRGIGKHQSELRLSRAALAAIDPTQHKRKQPCPVSADDKAFLNYPMAAEDKLSQQLNNPLANLNTVPIQSNFGFGGARALNVVPNAEHDPRDWGCVSRQCS